MANKNIRRGPSTGGAPSDFTNRVTANDIYVDGSTGALTLGTGTSGVGIKQISDNVIAGFATTTPYIETASVANGGVVPGVQGGPATGTTLIKEVIGIADAAATTVATVTVPNTANSATISVILTASLGAGGAVGANEASATAYGQIVLTRTAGLATVATAVALSNTGSAAVAGAATITLAYSVTAMTGANSATQTFNIQVTITKGSGSSTNHTCLVEAALYNANAAGVTIA